MKSLAIKRIQGYVLTACLAAAWASKVHAAANVEDFGWTPRSTLALETAADRFSKESDANGLGLPAYSSSLAQTNNWIREISLQSTQSMTLNGAPGEDVVVQLQDLRLSGNSILTLDGAADTNYLIKIQKGFSLSGNAQIVLTGGLTWDDVVFKVRGGGQPVVLRDSASFQGILQAKKRVVHVRNHAMVYGDVVGWVSLSGSGQIIPPPVVSP